MMLLVRKKALVKMRRQAEMMQRGRRRLRGVRVKK
jgi:hypothetical protein